MLKLRLTHASPLPLEIEAINPIALRGLSLSEIAKLPVIFGSREQELGEFFDISGNAADERLEWEGDLSTVHRLGTRMNGGTMYFSGAVGRHLGSEMRGGEIHVAGDGGDWLGAEMHGGLIHVRGSAGNCVGAAFRGSAKGMTGGVILVQGNTGHEAGRKMRRGLLAIGGDGGDYAGYDMLAGTIVVMRRAGKHPGMGMKRGTILVLGERPEFPPTFREACRCNPAALRLLAAELKRHSFPQADACTLNLSLWNGDFLAGGRGEIFIRA